MGQKVLVATNDTNGLSDACNDLIRQQFKIFTSTLCAHECLFKNGIVHEHIFENQDVEDILLVSTIVIANLNGISSVQLNQHRNTANIIRHAALNPEGICFCNADHFPILKLGISKIGSEIRKQLSYYALNHIGAFDTQYMREISSGRFANILVLGGGGREHAIVSKLQESIKVEHIFVAPGNSGTSEYAKVTNISNIDVKNIDSIVTEAQNLNVHLVVVGPEDPLVNGITDAMRKVGIRCFGPSMLAANLEGSKAFSKDFMNKHNIPTARYKTFTDFEEAKAYVESINYPFVIKASGLAAGKGVILPENIEEALDALDNMINKKVFGDAGSQVVIEERLFGEEVSVLAFCDGRTVSLMPGAQDHKRVFDNDLGPNTGGMGAYAEAPILTKELKAWISLEIMQKTIDAAKKDGFPYVGVLYAGIIVTSSGPQVLEFNCRFGDPETQVILPLLESDLFDIMNDCIDGCLAATTIQWSCKHCTTVVLAAKGYPNDYEKGLNITLNDPPAGVKFYHAGTTSTSEGLINTSGGRVLAVSAVHEELSGSIDLAYSAISSGRVQFQDMHFRKDIGQKALRPPVRLGVLGSTRGTDLQYIIDAINKGFFRAKIEVVISNKKDAYILTRAKDHGLKTVLHGMKGVKSRTEFDAKVTQTLQEHDVDLILCIGYMRILSDEFVDTWEGKVLNVHPSLLPEFAGGMDLNVHQEVLNAKKKETGCTIHFVTKEVDGGPIVVQKRCPVFETDDADILKDRVQAMEGPAFIEAILKLRQS